MSANIPLIKGNLVPLAFSDVRVDDYMAAMIAIYELQDVRPLTDLYVYSYIRTCAAYDSTMKSMGFDEVRVRYRQERRKVVQEVIVQGLIGDQMRQFVIEQANRFVAKVAQEDFVQDVLEDLEQMDTSRLTGLGITPKQLEEWQKKAVKRD